MEFCSDSLDCLLTFLFRIQANEPADQFADLYHSTVKVTNEGRKGGIQREGGGSRCICDLFNEAQIEFPYFCEAFGKGELTSAVFSTGPSKTQSAWAASIATSRSKDLCGRRYPRSPRFARYTAGSDQRRHCATPDGQAGLCILG